MKVAQVNTFFNKGGAGKIVKLLHEELIQSNIDAYVFYGRGEKSNDNRIIKFNNSFSTNIDAAITRLFGFVGYGNIYPTFKLKKMLKRLNPNIIHLHVIHGYYININIFFKFINKMNIPVVWTFHDSFSYTGKCAYYYSCDKWKDGCYKCPLLNEYPKTVLFDNTKRMYKTKRKLFTLGNKIIVTPSDWLRKETMESYFNIFKIKTINNGIYSPKKVYEIGKIEIDSLTKKYKIDLSKKIILGISYGQSDPRKGVDYLISAYKELYEENISLVLVGWDNKYDYKIKDLNNVITIPFIADDKELAVLYKISTVFVIPSIAENYPTVVLEALLQGSTVVGFDVGGIPELLASNRGYLVKPESLYDLIKNIKYSLKIEYSEAVELELKKYVKLNNSTKLMAINYISTYRELLDSVK